MREGYLQIAIAIIIEVIETEPAEIPILIVDLLRNLGCAKQLVLFIVIVEIYRFPVMADTHEGTLPVPCERAIAIIDLNGVTLTQIIVRTSAAGQQGKAEQHQCQYAQRFFHVLHIVLHQMSNPSS